MTQVFTPEELDFKQISNESTEESESCLTSEAGWATTVESISNTWIGNQLQISKNAHETSIPGNYTGQIKFFLKYRIT
jgi:hypothetical protein